MDSEVSLMLQFFLTIGQNLSEKRSTQERAFTLYRTIANTTNV